MRYLILFLILNYLTLIQCYLIYFAKIKNSFCIKEYYYKETFGEIYNYFDYLRFEYMDEYIFCLSLNLRE